MHISLIKSLVSCVQCCDWISCAQCCGYNVFIDSLL